MFTEEQRQKLREEWETFLNRTDLSKFAEEQYEASDRAKTLEWVLELIIFEADENDNLDYEHYVDSYDSSLLIRFTNARPDFVVPEEIKEKVKMLGFGQIHWYNGQERMK